MPSVKKFFWVLLLLLSACTSVDVKTDHDPSTDFSRYSTYYWKRLPDTGNPLMDGRIVSAVDGQLYGKGLRKVPVQDAQTALAADVATREAQQIYTFHDNWGPGWHGWGWRGPVTTTSRVLTYQVGTLVLDLYDARSKDAIWRGTASDTLSNNPKNVKRSMEEGVRQIFAKFPPGVQRGAGVN